MKTSDQMLARLAGEIENQQTFIDGVIEDAEKEGRDLNAQEMELITRARTRLGELHSQAEPIKEVTRIGNESRSMLAEISRVRDKEEQKPREIEYRSAGEYVMDRWRAGLGQQEAAQRLDIYHRAAAHQTTADNAGLIPTPIVAPVVNFIDASRPLVSWLGPRQLPGSTWSRPKVTQHTTVATQSAEKAELVSQKMLITKLTATAVTYGGYVNVSRQDVDFTQPGIMDIVINDLAAVYAQVTEAATGAALVTAATAGLGLPTGAITEAQITASLWDAAERIYTAVKGAGRVAAFMPPALLGDIGPLFPPIPAQPSQSPGLTAADFSTGLVGNIAGIPIYVSSGVTANNILVLSSAAAEVYEDRIGSLQVVEPSVLGVQVAYAGYYVPMTIEATGLIKVVKTP
jgi:HK97 family phage major capsid protein